MKTFEVLCDVIDKLDTEISEMESSGIGQRSSNVHADSYELGYYEALREIRDYIGLKEKEHDEV